MKKIILHRYDLKLLLDCVDLALHYYRYNAFVRRFRNYNTFKDEEERLENIRNAILLNFEGAKKVNSAFIFEASCDE